VQEKKDSIRQRALSEGFDVAGFCSADGDDGDALGRFLAEGRHGDMAWMAETARRRGSPKALWPEARSVVVLGLNYTPREDPLKALARHDRGVVSVYAQGKDYHDVVKKRLKRVARWMAETQDCDVKVFVDTAPVMEKPQAARAGVGWQGKHTNVVSRTFGSWLFLGEIFTTLDLSPDPAHADQCGTCRKCLDACPTGALTEPYRMDGRRCISYLTIEHKEAIPGPLRESMGNRIYGCDDCLAVCPWNKFAAPTGEEAFFPRPELTLPRLSDLITLDDESFRRVFAGTPIKRTGRNRMVRNALIAAGNSGDGSLVEPVRACLEDASLVVRETALWALERLSAEKG
jgi:epoxyqueuosine reductase